MHWEPSLVRIPDEECQNFSPWKNAKNSPLPQAHCPVHDGLDQHMMCLIQCLHVFKTYDSPNPVLQDINLEIFQGDFVFLLGKSGSGKSTFLKALFGLTPLDRGHIFIEGKDISQLTPREVPYFRREVGTVFQDFKLLTHKSVFKNVALPLEIVGRDDLFIQKRVHTILSDLNLDQKADVPCGHLSAAEQQRVAIARAVVNDPVIFLGDEPTASLDAQEVRQVLRLLDDMRIIGTTVVLTTHNASLPAMVPQSRVVVLHQGRLIEQTASSPSS